jgi:membrane AbrB-like protein
LVAAILFSVRGFTPSLPAPVFGLAQGMLGARIAQGVGPDFLGALAASWHVLAGGTVWAMLGAAGLGLFLARRRVMPGPTAIWGLSPGGAMVMTLMSAEHGADMRMVAFMQYTRVILVSLVTVYVARLLIPAAAAGAPAAAPAPGAPDAFRPLDAGVTVLGILLALAVTKRTGFPGGAIILSMLFVALLGNLGGWDTRLPGPAMLACYALIGFRLGGNFSREDLRRGLRVYPWILLGVFSIMALCALYGLGMWALGGFDPLTAYLSTSPGGIDVVTIIAADTDASLPFVATMQTMRLLLVILLGPWLARLATRASGTGPGPPPSE